MLYIEPTYRVKTQYGTEYYSVMQEVLDYLDSNKIESFEVWKDGEDISKIVAIILERKRAWLANV